MAPPHASQSDPEPSEPDVKRGTTDPDASVSGEAAYRALAAEAQRGSRTHAAQDADLLAAASKGDREAQQALVTAHLDWVVRAAEERAGRGLSQGDLFQEGSLGLMRAIVEFGDSGRSDFEVFAREKVGEQMDLALTDEDRTQDDKRRLVEAAEEYERAEVGLRRELGREPSTTELAAKLEWSVERTTVMGDLVTEARRKHDEELLPYLESAEIDLEALLEGREEGAPPGGDNGSGPEAEGGGRGGARGR